MGSDVGPHHAGWGLKQVFRISDRWKGIMTIGVEMLVQAGFHVTALKTEKDALLIWETPHPSVKFDGWLQWLCGRDPDSGKEKRGPLTPTWTWSWNRGKFSCRIWMLWFYGNYVSHTDWCHCCGPGNLCGAEVCHKERSAIQFLSSGHEAQNMFLNYQQINCVVHRKRALQDWIF